MTAEDFLSKQTSGVQALAQKTRQVVRDCNPDVVESVNPGRNNLAYGTGTRMGEWYCYIAPFKTYINLGFLRGTQLPDPGDLLEGTGKMLLHIKIRSIEDAERPGVKALLRAAAQSGKG